MATFGQIISSLAIGAGQSVRRDAGDTTFEAYTPTSLPNVTNDAQTKASIVPNTVPSAGQVLVGNAGGTAYAPVSMSGDATLASTGALTVASASLTVAGKVELATTAEINTGTDTTRAIPVDQWVASNRNIRYMVIKVIESATDVSTGTTLGGDFECPITGTIVSIGAWNDTAGTTGTAIYDVNLGGATIMTTNKIQIETTEKSSRTATTQPTLTTTAVTAGDIFTFDCDTAQTTKAKGLTFRIGIRES